MAGHKIERITENIKRELTAILRELKDPRLTHNLISIVKVTVTNDLSYCKIYISAIDGEEQAKEAVLLLNSASGFIKRELARRLDLRKIPELNFCATDSLSYSENITKILNGLKGGH
ncbi:MAG: 30S ribosome-binding factor RbfA [Clostridia bacterium]|nr:30S ribosome-binding factor RbfA [Clostridia bacterium]